MKKAGVFIEWKMLSLVSAAEHNHSQALQAWGAVCIHILLVADQRKVRGARGSIQMSFFQK